MEEEATQEMTETVIEIEIETEIETTEIEEMLLRIQEDASTVEKMVTGMICTSSVFSHASLTNCCRARDCPDEAGR